MLQVRLTLRVESTLDGNTGIDWFVVKQGDIYAVTCLVLLTPLWVDFLAHMAASIVELKRN